MKAGAYLLHIGCDHPGCPRQNVQFVGDQNQTEAFAQARRAGWKIGQPWASPDFCKDHRSLHNKRVIR